MHEPVIWSLGYCWRDLRPVVEQRRCTVVTTSLSTYLLAYPERERVRIPRIDGQPVIEGVRPLVHVEVATPCGLILWSGEDRNSWMHSTRVLMVLEGLVGNWADHPEWARVRAKLKGWSWSAKTHPPSVCGARYCLRASAPGAESITE